MEKTIAVFGAGSWGTALAIQLARAGLDVCLWGRNAERIEQMRITGSNEKYLPDIAFPASLYLTSNLAEAANSARKLLIVIPSHSFKGFLNELRPYVSEQSQLIWATKGLDEGSSRLLHQVAQEALPQCREFAIISGPTFALEVAKNLPTAVTVASNSEVLAKELAECLHSSNFRAYTSEDIVGVELGGALKNVLAIGAGIADGLGYGANTRAALITRGLAEIMRLGEAMGAHRETFMGLAGLGDLVLTCTDDLSRNRRMGLKLAQGLTIEQAFEDIGQAVEGVRTARGAMVLSERYHVELPIIEQVYRVLYEQLPPQDAVRNLLAREQKPEVI